MTAQKGKNIIIKTLVFIVIGSVSIVFADLFVLNRQSPDTSRWMHENIFTRMSARSTVAPEKLRSIHASYMEKGVKLPDSFTSSEVNSLFPRVKQASSSNDFPDISRLSDIEPALGTEGNIDFDYSKYNFDDVFEDDLTNNNNVENTNMDDVISNLRDNKAFKTTSNQSQSQSADIQKEKSTNEKGVLFEEYTHAPIDSDSIENTENVQPDGKKYIKPEGRGKIAIIIDDMGMSLRSRLIEVMPEPLTLSYLPYAENLKTQTANAIANGHEIMLHMPMEPINSSLDGGPHVLKSSQDEKEMLETIEWDLSQFSGYTGVNNHMGSKVTADKKTMDFLMSKLKDKGLFFVDSRTISSSVAAISAQEEGVPYAVRDIFIDHETTPEFINNALSKLEKRAISKGYAIAIGHPHKETIEALKEWLPTLDKKGLKLVPVSELLNYPANDNKDEKFVTGKLE